MNRFKNSTTGLTIFFVLLIFGISTSKAIAWENRLTHPAMTKKAVERSISADFLWTVKYPARIECPRQENQKDRLCGE